MATNFPTSLDDGTSLPEPSTGNVIPAVADTNRSQATKELEKKIGINDSDATTATVGQVLKADGSGGSDWGDEAGGTPEGTAVLSTGEVGASKFLREDGDNSCSWQSIGGGGDMLGANNLSDVASSATSFGNIKQDATTSATGVSELATSAETIAGTDTTRATTSAGVKAGIGATKLDDLSSPDDNTDLDATSSAHGLLPKLSGSTSDFLRGDGAFSAPSVGASDRVQVDVYNGSGSTLSKGKVVYISGFNVGQSLPEVELAKADASATMPAFGVVSSDVSNNSAGTLISFGELSAMDTSSWTAGDAVYVSPATAGEMTSTKPVADNLRQKVGIITRSHSSSGVMEVVGAGRTNDIPNFTAEDNVWVGGTGGVASEEASSTMVENAGALMDSEVDADIKTLALPASTTISTFGATVVDDADAGAVRTTIGAGTLDDVVDDTTPQLGGDLDMNGQEIEGVSETEMSYLSTVSSDVQTQIDGKQASMGADDNYVTDAEKVVVGNTSGANTGDQDIDDITPTTTKGDVIVEDGSNAVRLGVGTNDQVLTADSAESAGLKWADGGGGSSPSVNVETLTGNKTLTAGTDDQYQFLNTGGSNRTITLSTTGVSEGDIFVIYNIDTSFGDDYLSVTGGDYIYSGRKVQYIYDGANWRSDTHNIDVGLGYKANASYSGVAIGADSFGWNFGVAIGRRAGRFSDTSSSYSVCVGTETAIKGRSVAIGALAKAKCVYTSGDGAIAIGQGATVENVQHSVAIGYGAEATRSGEVTYAFRGGSLHTLFSVGLYAYTTSTTPYEMLCAHSTSYGGFKIKASTVVSGKIIITARDNTSGDCAVYHRTVAIKRDASNNTALVGTVQDDYTFEDQSAWDVAITADDTNETLKIVVTSNTTNTVRWVARFDGCEVGF